MTTNKPRKRVQPLELKKSIFNERENFSGWDDERRKKSDIVLEAIDRSSDDFNLQNLQNNVINISRNNEEYQELEDSAVKMLVIHYNHLSRTNSQQKDYMRRKQRARKKLHEYRKKERTKN